MIARSTLRAYLIAVVFLSGFIGLQFLFASLLSLQDFWRPRLPDGNERSLGPGVTDGVETVITQPALFLCQKLLSGPSQQSYGVLQPLEDLFRCAGESGDTSRLAPALAAVNTVLWAIGVATLYGAVRVFRALADNDKRLLSQLSRHYSLIVLPSVTLVVVAHFFLATSALSACLHWLLSALVFGSLWLGMFFLLKVVAERGRANSKLGVPGRLAVSTLGLFMLLIWQYLTISHVPLSREWMSDTLPYGEQFSVLPLRRPLSSMIAVASPVGLFPLGTILRSGESRHGNGWQRRLTATLFRQSRGVQASFAIFVAINSLFWVLALAAAVVALRGWYGKGHVSSRGDSLQNRPGTRFTQKGGK